MIFKLLLALYVTFGYEIVLVDYSMLQEQSYESTMNEYNDSSLEYYLLEESNEFDYYDSTITQPITNNLNEKDTSLVETIRDYLEVKRDYNQLQEKVPYLKYMMEYIKTNRIVNFYVTIIHMHRRYPELFNKDLIDLDTEFELWRKTVIVYEMDLIMDRILTTMNEVNVF